MNDSPVKTKGFCNLTNVRHTHSSLIQYTPAAYSLLPVPSSVSTKLPSPNVELLGIIAESNRKSRPFSRPAATRRMRCKLTSKVTALPLLRLPLFPLLLLLFGSSVYEKMCEQSEALQGR